MAAKRGRRWATWGPRIAVGLWVLVAGVVAAWGSATYFPDRALASQYLAAPRCTAGPVAPRADCVEWVSATVAGDQSVKGQETVWFGDWPEMTFNDAPGQVTGLRTGQLVLLPLWHGGANGLSVDGQTFYSDQSVVTRPMHDLVLAMLGAGLLVPVAMLCVLPVLRRRNTRPGVVRVVKWSLGLLSAGLLAEAFGTVVFDSFWGGPPLVAVVVVFAGGVTLLLIGVFWITGFFPRR